MYTVNDRRIKKMGNKIKEVRKSKGITQKELAAKLSVTPQAVSQFEKSDPDRFTIATLQNIAAALECKVDDLIAKDPAPEIGYYFETEKIGKNSSKLSKIVIDLGAVNRMGVDALENYIDLIMSNEKYTSLDTEFLKEAWGEETYYRFYAKETESQ
jgi:transcriptional regulator with XRE-family HTH domain